MARLVLLMALLAIAAPVAGLPPLLFDDEAGDVERGDQRYSGRHANAVDIISAGVREENGSMQFHMELANLGEYQQLGGGHDGATQYALTFSRSHDGAGFSLRAIYRNLLFDGLPLTMATWEFNIHDHQSDRWPPADGWVDGNTLRWTASPSDFGLTDGDVMAEWSASVWWSDGADSEQVGDYAATAYGYEVGAGVLDDSRRIAHSPVGRVCGLAGAAITVKDPEGDVNRGSDSYDGPGAASTDIRHACVADGGADVFFELALADLGELQDELQHDGFHAQYALSFTPDPEAEGYSARATYGGSDYTGEAGGAWRFSVHDKAADEWPEAVGHAVENSLVWQVPKDLIGVDGEASLTQWRASTWNSYESLDQYGDHADGRSAYRVSAPSSGAPQDASPLQEFLRSQRQDDRESPGPGLALLALATIAVAGRRRG